MTIKTHKYLLWTLLIGSFISLLTGFVFFKVFVQGDLQSTNILSVLFGWQWLYMAAVSFVVLVNAIYKKNKSFRRAAMIVMVSLALVLLAAQFSYSSRLYVTGDGGPAGPDFNCLVWKKSFMSGAYGNKSFSWCTFMSIPSFNKFYIDQGVAADGTDNSGTYYVMLVINEAVILGSIALAIKKSALSKERPKVAL